MKIVNKNEHVLENENGDLLVMVPLADVLKYGFKEAHDRLAEQYRKEKEAKKNA